MPAHHLLQPLISQADLRDCTGPDGIFELLRKLRYPVEQRPVADPLEPGDLPEALRNAIAARYLVARLGGARPGKPSLDVTLFVFGGSVAHTSALARDIATTWTRRYVGNHLLIFALPKGPAGVDGSGSSGDATFERLIFVSPERLGAGAQVRVKLRKLIVERRHPTRHDQDTLNGAALESLDASAMDAYKAQSAAFNVERMTNEFYREYAKLFQRAKERIRDDNKGVQDFYDPAKLHAFTQRLFGRVMFLYFLQKKRALDEDPNFIRQHYDEAIRHDENFYQAVLEPLFFETLNRPRPDGRSTQFGRVPYLNGGLFAEDELDHRGGVLLDNDLFDAKGDGGILYFLDNHNFTVEEDTPLEVEVALDPEMLGKVFENLLEAEDRGKSGTFYTPRAVVAFMCREALAAYLTRATTLAPEQLGWLLDEAETGMPARDEAGNARLTYHHLPFALHTQIERALESVRVLDPAVGSGAFPLGMLALLVGTRRALHRIRENEISPKARLVEDWKRAFIRDCLYGVDIRREAIEIARLRLWLSLVVDADPFDMDPLPNLDYKLMVGNSLIETFDGVEIYPTRPAGGLEKTSFGVNEEAKRLIAHLHELQDAYFQPESAAQRDQLKRQIDTTEADIVRAALRERRQDEQTKLENVRLKYAMLGGKAPPPSLPAELAALTRSIDATDATLTSLNTGQPLPFFLYRLHFAPVFEQKDGFDIVIANPPYVRHEKIAPATLAALKAAYPAVAHGMADLYVYFYARALHLLHAGGTLCFISSNKFFRAGYGKGLRETLNTQTQARIVLDFGDFPVFDAAAYPCVVIVDKGKPTASEHTYRGLTAGPTLELDKLEATFGAEAQMLAQADGVQPPAAGASGNGIAQKLLALGTPLGEFVQGKMYRGVLTGLNKAFVIDQTTRDRLIAEDARSAEVIKPFLRGRDIDRYNIKSAGLWLIRIENGWTQSGMGQRERPSESAARQYLNQQYPAIAAYLAPFADAARKRDDKGQYWWELRPCVYYSALEQPKIVFPDIAMEGEFAWDESEAYIGNTSYCIPTSQKYLCALLNTRLIGFAYARLSPQIRGNYYRFIYQYMERIPIVEPSAADQARLAELVDRLQALGGAGNEAVALEREVDAIVYRTYGLTADEIAIIENWHAERRALLGSGRRGKGEADLTPSPFPAREGEPEANDE